MTSQLRSGTELERRAVKPRFSPSCSPNTHYVFKFSRTQNFIPSKEHETDRVSKTGFIETCSRSQAAALMKSFLWSHTDKFNMNSG